MIIDTTGIKANTINKDDNESIQQIKASIDIVDFLTTRYGFEFVGGGNKLHAKVNLLRPSDKTSSLFAYIDTQRLVDYGGVTYDALDATKTMDNIGTYEAIQVIKEYRGDNPINIKPLAKPPQKPKKDLNNMYLKMKQNKIPKGLISQLINETFLRQCDNVQAVLSDVVVYDKYNQSLAIVIKG